ncbi:MAG: thermonuclease family protein [Phenylobacterium sp.]
MRGLAGLALGLGLACATPALADPCEAVTEDGPLPGYLSFGSRFAGPVTFVIDGDSFCVAVGPGHDQWVEVRLAGFFAPESGGPGGARAKAALERIVMGKEAVCRANLRSYDRIVAECTVGGRSVSDMMLASGVQQGGNGFSHASAPIVRGPHTAAAPGGAFRSCAAARAAGAAPMRLGEPGYNPNLDGDHDGIACEPYRGR